MADEMNQDLALYKATTLLAENFDKGPMHYVLDRSTVQAMCWMIGYIYHIPDGDGAPHNPKPSSKRR